MRDAKAPTEIGRLIFVTLNCSASDGSATLKHRTEVRGSVSAALPYFSGGHLTLPEVEFWFSVIVGATLILNCLIDTLRIYEALRNKQHN
jgi:hypothetical protein